MVNRPSCKSQGEGDPNAADPIERLNARPNFQGNQLLQLVVVHLVLSLVCCCWCVVVGVVVVVWDQRDLPRYLFDILTQQLP